MWTIEKTVSKGDYTYAVVRDHPNATKHGYVLEHRIIVENQIGRLLTKDEIVHHKNEQKKDNRPENLEILTSAEHARLHGLKKGRTFITLECPVCRQPFTRERRNTHLVKGGLPSKCSRTCAKLEQECPIYLLKL